MHKFIVVELSMAVIVLSTMVITFQASNSHVVILQSYTTQYHFDGQPTTYL